MVDTTPLYISLTLSCQNLPRSDVISKSDPYIELFSRDVSAKWTSLGRTETIPNTQHPKFTKNFELPYKFEEEQIFLLRVWDDDYGQSRDDFLGEASFKLGTLMGSRGQKINLPLVTKSTTIMTSTIIVRAENIDGIGNNDYIHLILRGNKLDRKDQFLGFGAGKSDPFFVISVPTTTTASDSDFIDIYKSEYIKQNLNPLWKEAKIPFSRLKGKDVIKITVTDYDADGTHDLIGIAIVSLDDLIHFSNNNNKQIPLIHPPVKGKYDPKKGYVNSGTIEVVNCFLEKVPTLVEYLRGGLQISLMVAIDFTGSNGDPRDPRSLHYGSGEYANQYIDAIQAVGNIVMEYDTDKIVPAFGFGAKANMISQVSHCFPLSGDPNRDSVYGVDGILEAYRSCFNRGIILSGPTYFSEVIRRATFLASSNGYSYSVLLLLTDGVVNDVQNTIDSIVEASNCPLSIIIVGVGLADFSEMNVLDGDTQPLISSRGIRTTRDIVQFVPFNQVVRGRDPSMLPKETLKELPSQVVEYFVSRKVQPRPPIVVQDYDIPTFSAASIVPPPPVHDSQTLGKIGAEIFAQAVNY